MKHPEPDRTLILGHPSDTPYLPTVHIWLEQSGDTIVLKSKQENYTEVLEARFFPNGEVIANHLTNSKSDKSNFRLVK